MDVYYATCTEDRTGRASSFYADKEKAETEAENLTNKAIEMNLKSRYKVASVDETTIPVSEKVRS